MNDALKNYFSPETIEDALRIKQSPEYGNSCFLAGGTDLKLTENRNYATAIDLKKIKDLYGITESNDGLICIGALSTVQVLETNEIIKKNANLLYQAARVFGSRQVRERGTVGGNICNSSPSADIATALLCLDATLIWASPNGDETETLENYYNTVPENRKNRKGCVLKSVMVPKCGCNAKPLYQKLGERKAMDIGIVLSGCLLYCENGEQKINVSLGSVSSSPVRARKLEAEFPRLIKLPEFDYEKAAELAVADCAPIDDKYASAEYRIAMVKNQIKHGLAVLLQEAK